MGKITRRSSAVLAGAIAATLAVAAGASADIDDSAAEPTFGSGSVERIASGPNEGRIQTAIAASQALDNVGSTVIITRHLEFADALAAAPLADHLDAPVLLNPTDALHADVRNELLRLRNDESVTDVVIIGGEAAISASVERATEVLFGDGNVERFAGDNRYETAVRVAEEIAGISQPALLTALRDAQEELAAFENAMPNLEDAVEDLREAIAALAAAYDAEGEAAETLLALQEEAGEIAAGFEDVPGFDDWFAEWTAPAYVGTPESWDELRDEIQEESTRVQGQIDQYNDAVDDIQAAYNAEPLASLGDIRDTEYNGDLSADDIQAVEDAITFLGLTAGDDTSLADLFDAAEDAAEAPVEGFEAERSSVAIVFVEVINAQRDSVEEADEISAGNAAVIAELDAIALRIADAEAAYEDAVEAREDAQENYAAARDAFDNLELPDVADELQDLREAVAEAQEALVAASPHDVLLTTGVQFPDALSAGALAGEVDGVVLLTRGASLHEATDGYLEANTNDVWAIGGPAVDAIGDDADVEVKGSDRYETAAMAAEYFTGSFDYVGVARGYDERDPESMGSGAADALVASAFMANVDGPLLLTRTESLPDFTADFLVLNQPETGAFVFGGENAVNRSVAVNIADILN